MAKIKKQIALPSGYQTSQPQHPPPPTKKKDKNNVKFKNLSHRGYIVD
jgi:hypothetical protein